MFDFFRKRAKLKQERKAAANAKALATERKEPWVNVIGMDIDSDNLSDGSFELDWNEYFIVQLVRAGYQGKTDADLVDQWFQDVCRNIVLETYEQAEANNTSTARHVSSRDIGDGRTEFK